jgi:hypothetical protein
MSIEKKVLLLLHLDSLFEINQSEVGHGGGLSKSPGPVRLDMA